MPNVGNIGVITPRTNFRVMDVVDMLSNIRKKSTGLFDYAASVWAYEPTLKPSTRVTITQAHKGLQYMVLQDILDYNKDLKKNEAEKIKF